MDDIFDREQGVLDDALAHIQEVRSGTPFDIDKFETLAKEYRILLKQQRKLIKISDRASTNMIVDQRGQITDLSDKVHYDALTGIYNRRYMEDTLNSVLKTMQRSGGGPLSVLMMDIDYFKKYNDTYGHSEGDGCLKSIAKAITGSMTRDNDFAARYGGEEFAVIMPNTDQEGARFIAERILENVRYLAIPHENSEAAPYVTLSIGAATGDVKTIQTGLEIVKWADEALYASKGSGRNRYTCWQG